MKKILVLVVLIGLLLSGPHAAFAASADSSVSVADNDPRAKCSAQGLDYDYNYTAHTSEEAFVCVPFDSVSVFYGNTYENFAGNSVDLSEACNAGYDVAYIDNHDNSVVTVTTGNCVAGLFVDGAIEYAENISISRDQNVYLATDKETLLSILQ